MPTRRAPARDGTAALPALDLDALPSPTAAKTLAILDLLARHPTGVSAADASRRTGVTANLTFRILKTLVALGYALQHPDTKTYTCSSRLLDLARPRSGERSLVVCAHDALRALRDATGETVQLVIESGGKGLVLEQVRGTHALQVSGQVGMQVPLHSCAPGKALLAWWSRERRAEWLRGRALTRYTATTLTTRADLERELVASRARGWTVDRAEGIEGIHCVAAPVLDPHDRPVAGVTIMAPASRMAEERFAALGGRCVRTARAIQARLRG
jgi:DNA-binding IclR family transcriptional regulator